MTEINDLFVQASRRKLRFDSTRGSLSAEDLWDLPLTAANGFSLDAIGRGINSEIRELTEDSLVESRPDPRKIELGIAIEIVKFVIATKQAENAAKLEATARAEKRRKIRDALAQQEDQALSTASREELLAMLDELGDETAPAAAVAA